MNLRECRQCRRTVRLAGSTCPGCRAQKRTAKGPQRPCLDCSRPTIGTRCPDHARVVANAHRRPLYSTPAWRRLRARVLADWRATNGNVCPGWQRPAHAAIDLAVDHVVPVAHGIDPLDVTNLRPLCRRCNGAKGAKRAEGGALYHLRRAPGLRPTAVVDTPITGTVVEYLAP